MSEGLSPIETGKKLHEHGEAAERAEKEAGPAEPVTVIPGSCRSARRSC